MKKILPGILIVFTVAVMLFTAFAISADNPAPSITGTLTTNKESYARGEKITLTANVTENTGFGALVMAFEQFPEGITRATTTGDGADATTTGVEVNGNIADSLVAGKSLVFDTNDGSVTTKTGTLFTGTYSIPQDFTPGTYTIKAKIIHIARDSGSGTSETEAEASNVDFATVTFTVTEDVKDTLVGDVDGDGEVTDADDIILERWLAGWSVTVDEAASDVDGDGEVTDADAILLARHLAGWPDNNHYFD